MIDLHRTPHKDVGSVLHHLREQDRLARRARHRFRRDRLERLALADIRTGLIFGDESNRFLYREGLRLGLEIGLPFDVESDEGSKTRLPISSVYERYVRRYYKRLREQIKL